MADRWLLARLFTYKLWQSFFYCCHDLVGKHFVIMQLSLPLVKFHCWKVTFVIVWERCDWRTCLSWTLSSIQHFKITKHRQSKTNQKHPHITWQWIIIIYTSKKLNHMGFRTEFKQVKRYGKGTLFVQSRDHKFQISSRNSRHWRKKRIILVAMQLEEGLQSKKKRETSNI